MRNCCASSVMCRMISAGCSAVIARSEATKQSILSFCREMDCFASLAMTDTSRRLMPPQRLAHIHGAVRRFPRAAGFGLGIAKGDARGGARGNGAAIEVEGEAIDRFLQRGRLGPGIGLAEIPQQQRELVAAEPTD